MKNNSCAFKKIGERGIQAAAEAMDRNGNLFFGLISPVAVGCWDSNQTLYDSSHIQVVVQNNETLQFASGMKVVQNSQNNEELWVLTCRYQVRSNQITGQNACNNFISFYSV